MRVGPALIEVMHEAIECPHLSGYRVCRACRIKHTKQQLSVDYPTLLCLRKRVQSRKWARFPPPPPPEPAENPVWRYLKKDEWETRAAKAKEDREEKERRAIIEKGILTAEGAELRRRLQEDLELVNDGNEHAVSAGELIFESGNLGRGVQIGDLMEVLTEGMYCAEEQERGLVRVYEGPTTKSAVISVIGPQERVRAREEHYDEKTKRTWVKVKLCPAAAVDNISEEDEDDDEEEEEEGEDENENAAPVIVASSQSNSMRGHEGWCMISTHSSSSSSSSGSNSSSSGSRKKDITSLDGRAHPPSLVALPREWARCRVVHMDAKRLLLQYLPQSGPHTDIGLVGIDYSKPPVTNNNEWIQRTSHRFNTTGRSRFGETLGSSTDAIASTRDRRREESEDRERITREVEAVETTALVRLAMSPLERHQEWARKQAAAAVQECAMVAGEAAGGAVQVSEKEETQKAQADAIQTANRWQRERVRRLRGELGRSGGSYGNDGSYGDGDGVYGGAAHSGGNGKAWRVNTVVGRCMDQTADLLIDMLISEAAPRAANLDGEVGVMAAAVGAAVVLTLCPDHPYYLPHSSDGDAGSSSSSSSSSTSTQAQAFPDGFPPPPPAPPPPSADLTKNTDIVLATPSSAAGPAGTGASEELEDSIGYTVHDAMKALPALATQELKNYAARKKSAGSAAVFMISDDSADSEEDNEDRFVIRYVNVERYSNLYMENMGIRDSGNFATYLALFYLKQQAKEHVMLPRPIPVPDTTTAADETEAAAMVVSAAEEGSEAEVHRARQLRAFQRGVLQSHLRAVEAGLLVLCTATSALLIASQDQPPQPPQPGAMAMPAAQARKAEEVERLQARLRSLIGDIDPNEVRRRRPAARPRGGGVLGGGGVSSGSGSDSGGGGGSALDTATSVLIQFPIERLAGVAEAAMELEARKRQAEVRAERAYNGSLRYQPGLSNTERRQRQDWLQRELTAARVARRSAEEERAGAFVDASLTLKVHAEGLRLLASLSGDLYCRKCVLRADGMDVAVASAEAVVAILRDSLARDEYAFLLKGKEDATRTGARRNVEEMELELECFGNEVQVLLYALPVLAAVVHAKDVALKKVWEERVLTVGVAVIVLAQRGNETLLVIEWLKLLYKYCFMDNGACAVLKRLQDGALLRDLEGVQAWARGEDEPGAHRLGHAVELVEDLDEAAQWCGRVLGMLAQDINAEGWRKNVLGEGEPPSKNDSKKKYNSNIANNG